MIIRATQKNTRQTPLKVRLVANQVKKLSLNEAMQQLAVIEKRSTLVILKVLSQAIANAKHNYGLQTADLELKNILVNDGPAYKRFRAVSRGRAHHVLKKTCHIIVELAAKDKQLTGVKKSVQPKTAQVKPAAKANPAGSAQPKTGSRPGLAPQPRRAERAVSQIVSKSAGQTAAHRRTGTK